MTSKSFIDDLYDEYTSRRFLTEMVAMAFFMGVYWVYDFRTFVVLILLICWLQVISLTIPDDL